MTKFSARLCRLMEQANLTGADLARWFDRPDPTVRGWISGAHDLSGPALDTAYIEACVAKLESLLRVGAGLPVPRMTPAKRIVYMTKLRKRMLPGAR